MEALEIENHPYFVAVQFHPEYLSRPIRPSPPYLGLLLAASGKLQSYLTGKNKPDTSKLQIAGELPPVIIPEEKCKEPEPSPVIA